MTYENSLTNTNITIAAVYGIIPFVLLLISQYNIARNIDSNRYIQIAIFIIILLASNSHIFIGVQSFWMLMLYGLKITHMEGNDESTLDS